MPNALRTVSTGEDLNETIFLVTNDEAMKEKLAKIGERLL